MSENDDFIFAQLRLALEAWQLAPIGAADHG
jgi:hypothetical protein